MAAITTNTRAAITKTVSHNYFFNVGGTWDGATATLEWSAEGAEPWYPIKDSADADVARTADSNGIVTTGKVGYLSVNITGGGESTQSLNVSLIPV
jgi:hypothetical protein